MHYVLISVLCFAALLSAPAVAGAVPPRLVYAGVLDTEPRSGCLALNYDHGRPWIVLEDYGGFGLGDTVMAWADSASEVHCGNSYVSYLVANHISAWRAFDFGCGTLWIDDEWGCQSMNSATFGLLDIAGATGFHSGDVIRLRANVFLTPCFPIPECSGDLCVDSPLAEACPSRTEVLHWGKLKAKYRYTDRQSRLTTP
jgi:hypothetical protein